MEGQLNETSDREERVHHPTNPMVAIDLGDSVEVKNAKFKDVLTKIG